MTATLVLSVLRASIRSRSFAAEMRFKIAMVAIVACFKNVRVINLLPGRGTKNGQVIRHTQPFGKGYVKLVLLKTGSTTPVLFL